MSFNVYLIQNKDLNTDAPVDFHMLDMDQMTEEKEYSKSHAHIFMRLQFASQQSLSTHGRRCGAAACYGQLENKKLECLNARVRLLSSR